ncbi:hypothetical protein CEQ90_11675 [Lewinellaceae bacterium SD302]|nr:hypothetical protein CEQ90_11675 [Lewinellaceae bacterium SD302]
MATIFLNSHRAKSGVLDGQKLPDDYVLLCKFFDCGIIDRTRSLDIGFDAQVLDEIPAFDPGFTATYAEISRRKGDAIMGEAIERNLRVQVLWSGGIDSTVALIALTESRYFAEAKGRVEVLLSMDSINEYPLFFHQFIHGKLNYTFIHPPITNHFADDALIVTGEHGDQLFGSDKLLPMIVNGLAQLNYEDCLPIYATNKFGDPSTGPRLLRYLEPLIESCPKPIVSAFDLFWWLNLSIKWQQVTLRLPIFTFQEDVSDLAERFRHFFREDDFQQWAFHQHETRPVTRLSDYKAIAKKYIFSHTGDPDYRNEKSKEPSLKHVIIDRKNQGSSRYRVSMKTDYKPLVETFHRKFKNQKIS